MSQANWSPTTGLNLSKSLPKQAPTAGPRAMHPSPPSWSTIPEGGQTRVEARPLPNPVMFGSLQAEHVRPLTPLLGRPNQRGQQPSGVSPRGQGGHSVQRNQLSLPSQVPPTPAENVRPVAITPGQLPTGGVWAPNAVTPDGRVSYSHDLGHPPWGSQADYHSMQDWRFRRVISDDRLAVTFNGVCNAARQLNGLDHRSDPLPWCRDGANPAREAHASARFNVHVCKQATSDLSAGEDECLRHLLVDSDEDEKTPGSSVERLLLARKGAEPTSSGSSNTPTTPTPASGSTSASTAQSLVRKDDGLDELEEDVDHPPLRHFRLKAGKRSANRPSMGSTHRSSGPRHQDPPVLSTAVIVTPAPRRHPFPRLTSPGSNASSGDNIPASKQVHTPALTSTALISPINTAKTTAVPPDLAPEDTSPTNPITWQWDL
ncbi:uncharacterized protein MELLADRAFT_104666 [Melampsora larici-populina 98AG31]|uniref:Uncharacterized protein n=1 Tax=Melampsora larici-populina (strain 98AG31 / pathotype 3-4-7) TaxID=747676 RepID=F4RFI0_MELLP|nr:uncharacterized protein MELLADRAFT_104666 [Melampsora larici-populina 98AG31]EGG08812.1 hypothetical protein MELLADRAFT_104666 [Melampsora larici-populina 98AG31]